MNHNDFLQYKILLERNGWFIISTTTLAHIENGDDKYPPIAPCKDKFDAFIRTNGLKLSKAVDGNIVVKFGA